MIRRLLPALLAFALSTAFVPAAHADTLDMKIDATKAEVKSDKKNVKDDKKDLKTIQKLRMKWEKARDKGNRGLEEKVDTDLAAWTRDKLAEGRMEISQAEAEVVEGGGTPPPEGSKPPVHGPGTAQPKKPPVHGPGQSPSPGVADDQEDLHWERVDQKRLREAAEELRDMQPKFTNGSVGAAMYEKKSLLLEELQRIAARELDRSQKELAEDQRELDRLKAKK